MIHYKSIGKGPEKVVLMHDWLGDHSNYDPILPYLDLETFTFLLPDLRGYGSSKAIKGQYTLEEASQDILNLLKHMEWKKFHLVGHSMGGMIGQKLFTLAPSNIKSFVGICPVSAYGMNIPEMILEDMLTHLDNENYRKQMFSSLWGDRLSEGWLNFKLTRWREVATNEAIKGYLRMFAQTNFAEEAKGVKIPISVLVGELDAPPSQEVALTKEFSSLFPTVSFYVIPNVGHYPMQESPPYLATLMEERLKAHI